MVYLNGDYVRLGDAKVSVLDRGFIFGDGIYEVVPIYNGRPFLMDGHLQRLMRSLKAIEINTNKTIHDWESLFLNMIKRSEVEIGMVYLQVTRGVAKRNHAYPQQATPTIFCMVTAHTRPSDDVRNNGLKVVSMPDERWLHCQIKSVSLLGNIMAKQYAVKHGVDDVIQFRDGLLTEGSSCNVWVVRHGILRAPLRDNYILEGIRYGMMEQLAKELDVGFEARPISKIEVQQADEIMVTSATKEVLPVTLLDGQAVGQGRPGPVYAKFRAAYDKRIANN